MQRRTLTLALILALTATASAAPAALADRNDDGEAKPSKAAVKSVEFFSMAPPSTPDQKTDVYSTAKVKVTQKNGRSTTYDLAYNQLMATGDTVNGKVVGGLIDVNGDPITDDLGQINSNGPDGTSLIEIPGMKPADQKSSKALALVTQYEYRSVPPVGDRFTEDDYWSRLPATMSMASLDQNKRTGALSVTDYSTVDFSDVNGLWVPCASSLSPWNTHLSSEEYEPDAKVREGLDPAPDSQDATDIDSFSTFYFGDPDTANPYNYGTVPEVTVSRDGSTSVEKHYALGRIARELVDIQPDGRTAYMGDDGAYTGLFMFVADRSKDLSKGNLYAGKWNQTSPVGGQGGTADLDWVHLGHGTDAEISGMVRDGIRFSDIFEVSNTDPGDGSFTKVKTYMGTEWLKVKPGMEKAAAFLETRRYAAMLGATTEFNKFEGVSHNQADDLAYVVMSRVESGMSDTEGDIQVAEDKAGAVYQLALQGDIKDTSGATIKSRYVGATMSAIPELLGNYSSTADASGNRCTQDNLCGGDNLKFSEGMRTLFVGEDTGYRNNNYVWAFNVDTRKLSRILSVPTGAEATGLQALDNVNGHAYITGNFQHPGEFGTSDPDWEEIKGLLNSKWNNGTRSAIGYIGLADGSALPAVK